MVLETLTWFDLRKLAGNLQAPNNKFITRSISTIDSCFTLFILRFFKPCDDDEESDNDGDIWYDRREQYLFETKSPTYFVEFRDCQQINTARGRDRG